MIENHTSFKFLGQLFHQDMVLFIFDEGIYAHRLAQPPVIADAPGAGAADKPKRKARRAKLAANPCGGWMDGWHPRGDGISRSWGNVSADAVFDGCDLTELPDIRWIDSPFLLSAGSPYTIFQPFQPHADLMFAWFVQPQPTRLVIIPRPMLAPHDPGFNPAFNEAAAHQVLAQGVLAPNRHCIEIRGADSFNLRGYQIEKPGTPPNLFFQGGVLIQTHDDAILKGFHPWPDAFCAVLPDDETIDQMAALLRDPEVSRATMLNMLELNDSEVPAGFCKVMVDKTDEGFKLTKLSGYVPLALADRTPNPAADPAITTGVARAALATSKYALEVDPRRVTRPPRVDAGSNWEIDEIAALTKAFYCNVMPGPIAYGIGHDYLMPVVEAYLHDPKLSSMLKAGLNREQVDAALERFHADRSMREWMLLRLNTEDLLAMIAKYSMKVAGVKKLKDHPAPFKDGEFKNAIVIAKDPSTFDQSSNLDKVPKAQNIQRERVDGRRLSTFELHLLSGFVSPARPTTTAMYYAPDGTCLVPGRMARELKHQLKVRAHPMQDSGWGEVEVIQL